MRPVALQPWLDPRDRPALRRAATFALVMLIHLLLLLMLLRLAPETMARLAPSAGLITFDVTGDKEAAAAASPAKAKKATPEKTKQKPTAKTPPPPPVTPPVSRSTVIWSQVIPLTSDQYAAADISKAPAPPTTQTGIGEGKDGAANGHTRGDTPRAGSGPNGEALYDAEWYRRPTNAELGFYLPSTTPPEGWGEIACQTVPDFRVENCQEIGQSPSGSGLSRAVRQAAWQFRVRPPRIGGHPQIGTWVRIHIDYSRTASAR